MNKNNNYIEYRQYLKEKFTSIFEELENENTQSRETTIKLMKELIQHWEYTRGVKNVI